MARYIDADALLENLKLQYGEELGWQCTVNMSDVGMMIEDAPTANVAPIADTVKKMRERLYRELAFLGAKDKFNKEYFLTEVDRVAKEILEGRE